MLHADHVQKHTATGVAYHLLLLQELIFFYLYIDYKHKHTATGLAHHVLRALCRNLFFLFFIFRLQAQARAVAQQQRTRGGFRQFFIDSLENVGYLNESTKGIYVKKRS